MDDSVESRELGGFPKPAFDVWRKTSDEQGSGLEQAEDEQAVTVRDINDQESSLLRFPEIKPTCPHGCPSCKLVDGGLSKIMLRMRPDKLVRHQPEMHIFFSWYNHVSVEEDGKAVAGYADSHWATTPEGRKLLGIPDDIPDDVVMQSQMRVLGMSLVVRFSVLRAMHTGSMYGNVRSLIPGARDRIQDLLETYNYKHLVAYGPDLDPKVAEYYVRQIDGGMGPLYYLMNVYLPVPYQVIANTREQAALASSLLKELDEAACVQMHTISVAVGFASPI